MKRVIKVIGWFFLSCMALFTGCAFLIEAPVEGIPSDEFGYQLGLAIFFAIIGIAILLELIGVRDKARIIKNKIVGELLYWHLVVILAIIGMTVSHTALCSEEYMQLVTEANKEAAEKAAAKKEETEKEETEKEETEREETEKEETEKEEVETEELDSKYAELSDEQFVIFTELMAKSFYSFNLDESDYARIENDTVIMECFQLLFDYAYSNSFELDPDYRDVFATKYDVVSKISNYSLLEERFDIGYYRDSKKNEWVHSINSYSINGEDVVEYGGVKYIDPEGYLKKGVVVYWIEDDEMVEVGEIVDIAYNFTNEGTYYPYALNVQFYDDEFGSGWRDGDNFLRANKKLCGKPAYYIALLDVNRSIMKEEIDYEGNISWKSLNESLATSGTEVYMGVTGAKTYMFKIVSVNKKSDIMMVEYPSGNVEMKSYSALVNDGRLFVK